MDALSKLPQNSSHVSELSSKDISYADIALDSGRLIDGRLIVSRFSKLAARCAEACGARSRLMETIEAAQEASDHLKARGFDATVIDRVLWMLNERFPVSAAIFLERLIDPAPVGLGRIGDELLRVAGGKWGEARGWRVSASEGSAMVSKWSAKDHPDVRGLGEKPLAARVSLANWSSGFQRELRSYGLAPQEALRFLAGHELGHVIYKAAGHFDLAPLLLDEIGVKRAQASERERVESSAEELFCDAIGALAAAPDDPSKAMRAAARLRGKSSVWTRPAPIYLRHPAFREGAAKRLSGGGWRGEDGAVDLAAECLAMALARGASLPVGEARRRVGQAFKARCGRDWLPVDASASRAASAAGARP